MKKQCIILLLLAVVCIQMMSACRKVVGEGPVVTETRNPGNFSGIRMGICGNVYYTQGNFYKLEIKAQQNILDVIETPIINNDLVIRVRSNRSIRTNEDITINITTPAMSSLSLSGSGNINAIGTITSPDMWLSVSGSGDIHIPALVSSYIDAGISGSGSIVVFGGSATNEQLTISGSGSIDLLNVPVTTSSVKTSGSGTSKVNVSQNLDVNISGSGTVFYKGSPSIHSKISGSGVLVHL
jgi:hypothetical protein